MQQRYFYYGWAVDGDLTQIPMPTQSGGLVSYQVGYNSQYQDDLATDPSALAIERAKMNSFFNDITINLQNYQQYGSPEFIDSTDNQGAAFAYDVGAVVRYSSSGVEPFTTYVSLVTNNTTTPGTAGYWTTQLLAGQAAGGDLTGTYPAPTLAIPRVQQGQGPGQSGSPAISLGWNGSALLASQGGTAIGSLLTAAPGRLLGVISFPANGTAYPGTCPAGTGFIEVIATGAGGGGSGCYRPNGAAQGAAQSSGAGGGGGAQTKVLIQGNFSNASYTAQVGVGGYGSANSAGGSGGSSVFTMPNITVTAGGGYGGGGGVGASTAGGAGGVSSVSITGYTYDYYASIQGGVGSDGQSNSFCFAGNGGCSAYGAQGRAGNAGGINGGQGGGGGGGAYDSSGTGVAYYGGQGGSGQLELHFYSAS